MSSDFAGNGEFPKTGEILARCNHATSPRLEAFTGGGTVVFGSGPNRSSARVLKNSGFSKNGNLAEITETAIGCAQSVVNGVLKNSGFIGNGSFADLDKTAIGCSKQTVSNVLEASGLSRKGNLAEIGQTAISGEDELDAADDADEASGISDGRRRLTKDQIQVSRRRDHTCGKYGQLPVGRALDHVARVAGAPSGN